MSKWHHTLAGTYGLQWTSVDRPGKRRISGTQPLARTANRTVEVGLPNDSNDVDVREGETVADSVSAAPPTSWGRSPPPVVARY